MVSTATTTLQIKTSGINLYSVETVYVLVKQSDFQTAKSNDSIEVDGDVISVLLTKDESQQLKSGGGTRVTVTAVDSAGISYDVKVVWVKFGSVSSRSPEAGGDGTGGGAVSPPVDLPNYYTKEEINTIVSEIENKYYTKEEIDALIESVIGGNLPFQIDKWYVISASEYFTIDGNTWNLTIPSSNVVYSLSMAIEATEDITVNGMAYFSTYALVKIRFNGENSFNKEYTSRAYNSNLYYALKKGTNTLRIDFWKTVGNASSISMTIPDAVQSGAQRRL